MWVLGRALFLGGPLAEVSGEAFRWTLPVRKLLLLVSGALDLYPPKAGCLETRSRLAL